MPVGCVRFARYCGKVYSCPLFMCGFLDLTSLFFSFQAQFEFALTAVAEEVNAILQALSK